MSERVLLVDDDEFARGFARTVLERAGFEVFEAHDVASALNFANSQPPAAIVTDWNLPDGDGSSLAQYLSQKSARIPLILITGDSTAIDSHPDIAPSFSAIITKPYKPSALEQAIRDVLVDRTGRPPSVIGF